MNVLNEVNYKILSVMSESIVDSEKGDMLARVNKDGYDPIYAFAQLWYLLQGDREFFLSAVSQNTKALEYASAELKNDREIVLVAVSQTGAALRFASAELKGDREIVLAAVKEDGYALQYASVELKGDQEIVLAAVSQNGEALDYASDALKNGDLETHVTHLIKDVYNMSKQTFIVTILFGATQTSQSDGREGTNFDSLPPSLDDQSRSRSVLRLLKPSIVLPGPFSTQIKQKIWEYAGVQSGERWLDIESAARNLGISPWIVCFYIN